MSKSARFGPVQVEFREDGSLFIYQPNPDVILGKVRAYKLVEWLTENEPHVVLEQPDDPDDSVYAKEMRGGFGYINNPEFLPKANQSTVPDGVVNTSTGPTGLTDTEQEADKNASEARAELGASSTSDSSATDGNDARATLAEMTATAEADGTAELATEFVDTRASIERGVKDVEQGNVKPAPRRRGRPPKAKP